MVEQAPEQNVAPVEAAPAPVQETTPAVVTETVIGPEAVTESPKEETKPVVETKTVAEPAKEAPKTEAPKVEVEQPKKEEAKKEEAKPAEQAKPVSFESFKLPEGAKADDKSLGEFTSMLTSFEGVSKADHAELQKFGQALVDYHSAKMNEAITSLNKAYQESWEKQTQDWRKQFEADTEIGGKRQETTVKAANDFIRTHGGTEAQQKEFRELMAKTGLGNHPAMIRILANAGLSKKFTEGSPVPAQAPAPDRMSKLEKMYGKKKSA